MSKKRIGILTGGGDAPGLNGIIEASCRVLLSLNYEVIGINDGFEGIYQHSIKMIDEAVIRGAHAKAGTLLGTSNRSSTKGREKEFLDRYQELRLDGLIVAGGDGTFAGLKNVGIDLPVVGVPKTIDNDLAGTEVTFGYDTACSVVAEAIDSLRATAQAHRRVLVVETMGRTTGWIALGGGLASYADAILIPERPFSRARLTEYLKGKQRAGVRGLVIAVSEGAMAENETATVAFRVENSPQAERYGGVAESLARWIEQETQWESRHVVLGHLQRSRHPTTTDRFLTLAMGVEAARMVEQSDWGKAVVYRQGKVQRTPLSDLMQPARLVPADHRWIQFAKDLQIFI